MFDDIENEIIDTVYFHRKEWCNCDSVPRYEFQEAFHQPIKIKNNETIISCYVMNNCQEKLNLINEIYKNKILVSYVLQYEGFELSEYEIFPLIKIIDMKEKVVEFSKKIVEKINNSSESEDSDSFNDTELEIYPTDIEKLEKPTKTIQKKKEENENSESEIFNSNLSCSATTQKLLDLIDENNISENEKSIFLDFQSKISKINDDLECISNESSENLNENINNIKISENFESNEKMNNYFHFNSKNLNSDSSISLTLDFQNNKKNISNHNHDSNTCNKSKKKNKNYISNYVSKMELSKIKNNYELSKMLSDTIENGYMSQLEKANSYNLKK